MFLILEFFTQKCLLLCLECHENKSILWNRSCTIRISMEKAQKVWIEYFFPVPLCNSYHSVPQLPWPTKPTNHVASKALSNTVAFSPTLWLVGSADANPPVQSPSPTNARGAWKCKAFCHQRRKDEKIRFFSRQRLERLWPIWMSTKMTKNSPLV